jgi:soluble lytic murein transglycosylase-like protein
MLLVVGISMPALATGAPSPSPAERLNGAERAVVAATAGVDRFQGQPAPATAIDQLRHDLQLGHARFGLREALRAEQQAVYALAADPEQEAAALPHLAGSRLAGLSDVDSALRHLWRLTGIPDSTKVQPRWSHRFSDAEPVDSLIGYYRAAATSTGVDWSYLAAINYLESNFGRNNGPSSAGALGPMQFLPSTWQQYGAGDIMNPRDSIQAGAVFLSRHGAPADYDQAIFHYNRDSNYVAAVKSFAAALRAEPYWLTRLYYWSTFG